MIEVLKVSITRGINHIGLTVPNIDDATRFFTDALEGQIAYDSQTKLEPPRDGNFVEHVLGLTPGAQIVKKRMMVFENAQQQPAQQLQDIGFTHISFYVDNFEAALQRVKKAGGQPISEPHSNTKYEDTADNQTVYIKTPWGSLIELQTVPHGYYYPGNSERAVFIPKSQKTYD